MIRIRTIAFIVSLLLGILLRPLPVAFALEAPPTEQSSSQVLVVTVSGVINPISAEFMKRSIREANEGNFEALIVELDTPGGLMDSMREIIKDMLGSDTPIVVFVSPNGARAASAGAFITMAAHVAAMAPQSNIGAAHPVNSSGGEMDETMAGKVTNDAVAYIKSLAETRGRNTQWAQDAVKNSISSTATEALSENVIDLISNSLSELLTDIDGRTVETASGERTLKTAHATVVRKTMSLRQRILDVITSPNVAYILMVLGFYGLFFELTNPGAIFPGVVGAICLILAFYAFQSLPVNYAGVLLIILSVVLFILEAQITAHGALAIGGVASMALGSLMLFDSAGPLFRLSITLVLITTALSAAFFLAVITLVLKAHKRKALTGNEGLIGMTGIASTSVGPEGGTVMIHGELWAARAAEIIHEHDTITVESVDGLTVTVRKI